MKKLLGVLFILVTSQIFAQEYNIKIAGMPAGNVDYAKAKAAQILTVEGPDNPEIIRFRITHNTNTFEYSATSYSAKFTKEQRDIIYEMFRNSKLYVDKIRIKTDSRIIDLPSVMFKLSSYDALNLATLGGKNGGIVTRSEILADPYIRLNRDVGTVISFSLSFNQPSDSEYTSNSDKLTQMMIEVINTSKRGWTFWISNVKIRKADNTVIIANSATFRLQ